MAQINESGRSGEIKSEEGWACLGAAGRRGSRVPVGGWGRFSEPRCGSQEHLINLTWLHRYLQNIPPNAESAARLRLKRVKKIGLRIILPACLPAVFQFPF